MISKKDSLVVREQHLDSVVDSVGNQYVPVLIGDDPGRALQLPFAAALRSYLVFELAVLVKHLYSAVPAVGDDDVVVSSNADKRRLSELTGATALLTHLLYKGTWRRYVKQ